MSVEEIPSVARDAVLKKSSLPKEKQFVKGYDFNDGIDYNAIFESYKTSGFQATNLGLAIEEINKMLLCRDQSLRSEDHDDMESDPFIRRKSNCTIFLGYTSNMASSGIRDTIRFLVQ
ncbi:putative deoxyhypusine synthase, partial [Stegodyphus mimosarum]